ncbi:Protein zntD [Babesia sp. Xinjiang]|uniref:Protein zntD n=1 Tax=Babesia sp. Xinjiang TaxID=462227 RepID=UPI000A2644EF|nr:Protein zntD [Babesia sp. Xinjiang]XP_028872617.1 Protein zntD [Babesia sp. Xinjiang]ORM42118.1 Protein zntD [Babesia sp. Xinjiang]ORM42161.1 Protein zntD [Babesia sp. Xinjiang]
MGTGLGKFLSAVLIGLSGLAGCMIPYLVYYFSRPSTDVKSRQNTIDSRLCLCNCLGAGIIMGMAYLHILPEAVLQWEHSGLLWNIGKGHFNPVYFIALLSFCMMLFIERVLSSGRTPCSAAFNVCQEPDDCCGVEQNGSCCESASRSAACELETLDEPIAADEECAVNTTADTFRARFRHHHSRIIARWMKILCPLCECNGLCITLALFIHSLFEGIVVGLVDSQWNLWLMTVGIILHKWAAGMALSAFVSTNSKRGAFVMQTIFCLSSPLGILIGGLTAGTSESAEAILNSIAVGTLIYIGMEIITHELFCHMHCRKTAFCKWLCVIFGTLFILATAMLEVYITGGCAHSHVHEGAAASAHAHHH